MNILLNVNNIFCIDSPFVLPDPKEDVLSITLCARPEDENNSLLFLENANMMSFQESQEGGHNYHLFLDNQSTFYSFLSDLETVFSRSPEVGWLQLKTQNKEALLKLTDIFFYEKSIAQRLISLNRALFGDISPAQQHWIFAIRRIIGQIKRYKKHVVETPRAKKRWIFAIEKIIEQNRLSKRSSKIWEVDVDNQLAEQSPFFAMEDEEPFSFKNAFFSQAQAEFDQNRPRIAPIQQQTKPRKSIYSGNSFWEKFLTNDSERNVPAFYLDYSHVFPEKWKQFHTIDIVNIDYRIIQVMMELFKNTERFCVNNEHINPLPTPVQLRFTDYARIYYIALSFDEGLFVHDYEAIVNNYPGNDYAQTRRKIIAGPLYSARVNGHTMIPAAGHPLIFDAAGISGVLPVRTQKLFSSLPTAQKNVQVEFYGSGSITAIDFGRCPVTTSFLESLFQSNIYGTFDPIATWDDRLGWANKFTTMRYLDLSATNVNSLRVLQNFAQLNTLIVNQTAFLDLENARFLLNLERIECDLKPYPVIEKIRANWNFLRLNAHNFFAIKHSFYPILFFCVGLLGLVIKTLVQTSVEQHVSS